MSVTIKFASGEERQFDGQTAARAIIRRAAGEREVATWVKRKFPDIPRHQESGSK
jgi:hypothetical protein